MRKLMVFIAILSLAAIVLVVIHEGKRTATTASAIEPLGPATGPLRVHPSNPRYFTDGSGKAIYLTGSHNWWNLADGGDTNPPPAFDYTAYLDFLQTRNHNFIRMWRSELALYKGTYVEPHPWARTGPGTALDGRPKFDLNQFNQPYFDRLRSRILAARDRGIYVSIMLFEGFGLHAWSGVGWAGHPMHASNNIDGINGDPNGDGYGIETQTLQIGAINAIQKTYVRKVIETVNYLDNVLYEICNECGSYSRDWQYDLINYIKSYEAGKPKQHPVGMTFPVSFLGSGTNKDLFNSPADWISPGQEGGYDTAPPAATGTKVILADTDHIMAGSGDADWVWKSFTRGLNPIFMDGGISTFPTSNDWRVSARNAMGHTLTFANKVNLAAMTPRSDLASTEYCLANPGREYLVYLPPRRRHSMPVIGALFKNVVTVDLSSALASLNVEWFNPRTGEIFTAESVTGGGPRTFTASFGGDAVLYLKNQ